MEFQDIICTDSDLAYKSVTVYSVKANRCLFLVAAQTPQSVRVSCVAWDSRSSPVFKRAAQWGLSSVTQKISVKPVVQI